MMRTNLFLTLAACGLLGACKVPSGDLATLQQENTELRAELDRLRASAAGQPAELRPMPQFVVGLAAAERDFDSGAFEQLLQESLASSSPEGSARVARETDDREIEKVRGMLLQQYLAAGEIPVRLTNLTFKLQGRDHEFKIGGQMVPRSAIEVAEAATGGDGSGLRAIHRQPVPAVMQRDGQGHYFIPYEELGAGGGRVTVQTSDAEILDSADHQRSQRQGDISFNWSLDLKEVVAFRVQGFKGDVAQFLVNMRYSGVDSPIAQYQTMRDVVFLFGYGRYVTSVVSQIRTPAHIDEVQVAAIDQAAFDALQSRMTEQQILDTVGAAQWLQCEFVDFAGEERIWERPASVPFPFVSRQVSAEGKQVFYLKYATGGASFIGDFEK